MTEVRRRGRPGQQEPSAQKGAQALERGIAILQYLEKSGGSSSVSDISLNLDLPLSTTFRLLKVLEGADFVYQDLAHSISVQRTSTTGMFYPSADPLCAG